MIPLQAQGPPTLFSSTQSSLTLVKSQTFVIEDTLHQQNPTMDEKPHRSMRCWDGSLFTVWLSAICALALLILTSIYAGNSSLLAGHRSIGRSPSNVLLVLRVLSELAGVMLATTIAGTIEVVQWTLISRHGGKKGTSFTDYLVMHAGTGVPGLLRLAFGHGVPKVSSRFWSIARLAGIAMVPLLNVVIMSKYLS